MAQVPQSLGRRVGVVHPGLRPVEAGDLGVVAGRLVAAAGARARQLYGFAGRSEGLRTTLATLGDKHEPYYAAKRLLKAGRNEEAFEIYRKLAEEGDPNCQVFLGWMLWEGIGTPQNASLAFEYFKRAATVGSARGAYACANYLLNRRQFADAIPYLQASARLDFSPALLWLGICYLRGRGIRQDSDKALRLIERAAHLGNWMAKRKLASLKIAGYYGRLRVVEGLIALPFVIVVGLARFLTDGYSEKFMG